MFWIKTLDSPASLRPHSLVNFTVSETFLRELNPVIYMFYQPYSDIHFSQQSRALIFSSPGCDGSATVKT